MHIIFRSSTYGDPDLELAAWSIIQSSTRTLRRRTGSLIADLVEEDRLHASTACKAHPVGYRDIPRGPFILHMAETFSSAHIAGAAGSTLIAGAACSTLIAGGSVRFRTAGLRAEPEQHLLSGDVTPPEDQRSPSADQGFPQRTSGTSYEPVCANPNPAVACASAPLHCKKTQIKK